MCVMSEKATRQEQTTPVTYAPDELVRALARDVARQDAEILERLAR